MMASSAVVSVAIAIVSWKLIEERALGLKGDFAEATSRAFNLGLAKIAASCADAKPSKRQARHLMRQPLTPPARGASAPENRRDSAARRA